MDSTRALLDAIGTLYSAPGHAQGWQAAIETINDLVGGRASAFLVVNKENLNTDVGAYCGFSDVDRQAYAGPAGAAKDIRFQYLSNLTPGQVFREFEFVPDRAAWDASPWIQYQRRELGCYWCMSARVSSHGLWDDIVSINRLERLGPHTDQEKAHLQALLPHLAGAVALHRTLTSLERLYGAVLAVLDHLLVGLAIVVPPRQVAVANLAAREISELTGLFRLTPDGRLCAADPKDDAALTAHIDEAIATAAAQGDAPGRHCVLQGKGRAISVEVLPLRDDSLPDGYGLRGAAVFLLDPTQAAQFSLSALRAIFGLTGAELAVTRALVNGSSVNIIAEDRRTSADTVRQQLKAVYAKTGVNSQLDLLRLAIKASPPIRH